MKKTLSIVLSLIMLLSVLPSLSFSSYAATSGDYEYTFLSNGTAEITEYKGTGGNVTIPSALAGYTVTSIGSKAFYDRDRLTSVTIPNSVTSIGSYAFEDCDRLKNVTIGNGVKSIAEGAFAYCYSLTSINVDSNNKNYSSQDGVLFNKNKTTLIQHPNGKTRTSYTIPNSVKSIGSFAFADCDRLTSVTIPNSVTSIGDSAFRDCYNLKSVTIGSGVTSIGVYAFYDCDSLKSVTIPNSVTNIGDSAFSNCERLTSVTIGNGVKSIGRVAFYKCDRLTSVTIGSGVKSIGRYAFAYSKNIKDVYYIGSKAEWKEIYFDEYQGSLKSAKRHYVFNGKITLSKAAYTYDGKAKKPSVTVKDKTGNKISSKYYTVTYQKGRKKVSKYTVTVKFKNDYQGTVKKTFTINPKGTTLSSVKSPSKGKIQIKWKKGSGVTGYQVQISTKSNFDAKSTKTLSFKASKTSTTGKLTSKKKHYFRIRTYKTVKVNGKNTKIYSSWSKAKSVTVK